MPISQHSGAHSREPQDGAAADMGWGRRTIGPGRLRNPRLAQNEQQRDPARISIAQDIQEQKFPGPAVVPLTTASMVSGSPPGSGSMSSPFVLLQLAFSAGTMDETDQGFAAGAPSTEAISRCAAAAVGN